MAGRYHPRWPADVVDALIFACIDRQPDPISIQQAVRRLHAGTLAAVGVQEMSYTTARYYIREERQRRAENRLSELALGPVTPALEQIARRMISAADDEMARIQGHASYGQKPLDMQAFGKLTAAVERLAGIAAKLPRDQQPTATVSDAPPTEPQLLDALRNQETEADAVSNTHRQTATRQAQPANASTHARADTTQPTHTGGVLLNVSEQGSGVGDVVADELAAMRENATHHPSVHA